MNNAMVAANNSPEVPMTALNTVLVLARKHLGNGAAMESSARLCMADAMSALERDDYTAARMWAVKSLSYSVGVLHADYERCAR